MRRGISYFATIEEEVAADGLRSLAEDLTSGAWAERFGHLLKLDELDTGNDCSSPSPENQPSDVASKASLARDPKELWPGSAPYA